MRIEQQLLTGKLITRENRFRARVRLGSEEVAAHVPNSGRLSELFRRDRQVLLAEARAPHRVTDYDLLMVLLPTTLVSIDARLPNRLFDEAVQRRALPEFDGLSLMDREVSYGHSRLDFMLGSEDNDGTCLVEVKPLTLVQVGIGRFPGAVTERGRRHLRFSLSSGMMPVPLLHPTSRTRCSAECCVKSPLMESKCMPTPVG